jgi:hypothetical protein
VEGKGPGKSNGEGKQGQLMLLLWLLSM